MAIGTEFELTSTDAWRQPGSVSGGTNTLLTKVSGNITMLLMAETASSVRKTRTPAAGRVMRAPRLARHRP